MEVQAQLLHHNPYEMVKREDPSSPSSGEAKNPCEYAYTPQDVIFGNFQLQSTFCNPMNNNNELINHNHAKLNPNGRALAADRKRPYPCNICPSRFGSKMELEEHQNSHTGMKPFECDVCKARFNRRSTLWNHKRIHSDAKPFVCSVCQMQFKWKNSLKCHAEMHSRKGENEASQNITNDFRQLTYATAAKRKLMMEQEEQGNPATSSATISNQPLITTTTSKKNAKKVLFKSSPSTATTQLAPSLHAIQPLQASSLIPPSDHHLDLDTSSLDTLVQGNSSLLMQLYGDMDPSNLPRQSMLSALDESSMLGTQLITDVKPEVMATTPLNMHMTMNINMLNFRPINSHQLPSVHHLSSAPLPVTVNMAEYTHDNLAHPQYIVTTQPDMMISQQAIAYQHPMEQPCVILAAGPGHEYMPNFDYNMINANAQYTPQQHLGNGQVQTGDEQGGGQMGQGSGNGTIEGAQAGGQMQSAQGQGCDEKVLPYEQW